MVMSNDEIDDTKLDQGQGRYAGTSVTVHTHRPQLSSTQWIRELVLLRMT